MRSRQIEGSQKRKHIALPGDSRSIGLAAIALAALLWAVSATMARTLFDEGVDPIDLTSARAYLAFICLAAMRPWRRATKGNGASRVAVVALGLSIALVNAAYYLTIERLPVAVAIVIQYTSPVMVVAWMSFGRRAFPSRDLLIGLTGAVAGVLLAAELGSVALDEIDTVGLALGLASAVLFASYTLLSESIQEVHGAVGTMFRGFGVATVFWIVVQAFSGFPVELIETENLPRVLYVGIAGTFVPFVLFVWGIRRVSAERAVIAASLEPPAAAVVAWIWLGQGLSGLQMVGGLLVLGAVISLQLRAHDPARAPEP